MSSKKNIITRSEFYILELLMEKNNVPVPAAEIATILESRIGWKPTTTYTLITRCIEKGAIERKEPKFLCSSLINAEQLKEIDVILNRKEQMSIINKILSESKEKMIASLTPDLSNTKRKGKRGYSDNNK